MSGLLLATYVALWLLVLLEGLVLLAIARECESLRERIKAVGRNASDPEPAD